MIISIYWKYISRFHQSSGSGSESGTQAQKSVNSKSNVRYDNSSKDGDDNENTSGGSDDGSGTQVIIATFFLFVIIIFFFQKD